MSTMVMTKASPSVYSTTDEGRLQGVWVTTAGLRDARLLIAGRHYTLEFRDGVLYMGTYLLGPTDEPRRMEMFISEGPAAHRGLTTYCIYQFQDELLRWCPSVPGSASRLVRFPRIDDSRYLSLVFRPLHPHRGV
jgi:uncharacterized protein (TIGR03067 family)